MKYFKLCLIFMVLLTSGISYSQDTELKILFIGNSLTYTNDLPKLVEEVAEKQGLTIKTDIVARPEYALLDHWEDGKIQRLISRKNYDLVIIQQGPSSQEFGKRILIEYGGKIKALCEQNDTQLAYLMVWPSRRYYHTFEKLIENHREAAKINKALLIPVGEVWKKHFEASNNFDYYGPDQFHPSKKGSRAAAEVIASEIIEWKKTNKI
ncbi:SGNH/GDSL hydrolase family protein [Gramella aestuarii]|uniref:SGNH/GDSL hydrolase family protein n=2 Tax=Christiangramia aestuarii TaxID=1028746 RepID=A0A7M3SY18_9FLAO|nr:SGNH/GDSL hydrolase family protein [Christiangramia aestuarii]